MGTDSENTDRVFSALADNTRRKVVEMLHEKDASILELSESFSMSFQGLSKHIKILETAGIVNKRKKGKYTISVRSQLIVRLKNWIRNS